MLRIPCLLHFLLRMANDAINLTYYLLSRRTLKNHGKWWLYRLHYLTAAVQYRPQQTMSLKSLQS
jgi:hypothetical protein